MDPTGVIVAVFLGLAALRVVLVAVGAALIMRPVIECPACFDQTFAQHAPRLRRLAPWLEWRWCVRCGWQGPARRLPPDLRRRLERTPEPRKHPFEETGGTLF